MGCSSEGATEPEGSVEGPGVRCIHLGREG